MSIFNDYKLHKTFKQRKLDYATAYRLWYEVLANKVLNLFTWTGLPFEQKELEVRLQLMGDGIAGVLYSNRLGRFIVANGSPTGITEYADKWLEFTWSCPVDFGTNTIDEDVVLFENNSLHLPTRRLVQRYAHLLAHAELSLQAILINARATGIIAAKDEKQKQDIADFYKALEDGRTMAIVDDDGLNSLVASEGLRSISTAYPAAHTIIDFWDIRQNLYKEFLTEIGISKATDKKERMITDEVAQDKPMYQYSLDDMLRTRKIAAKKASTVLGLDLSVEINKAVFEANTSSETGVSENDNTRTRNDEQ